MVPFFCQYSISPNLTVGVELTSQHLLHPLGSDQFMKYHECPTHILPSGLSALVVKNIKGTIKSFTWKSLCNHQRNNKLDIQYFKEI